MNHDVFLYTVPQWFVFSALFGVIYGWIEQKKVFRLIGLTILVLLAIFAVYAISAGYFAARGFLTPEEIVKQDMEEELTGELPLQARLLPAYLLYIASGILALPALFFDWKEKKPARLFIVLAALAGLSGFFVIAMALKQM